MSVLSAQNHITEKFVTLNRIPGWEDPSSKISNVDINRIMNSRNAWALDNSLIFRIEPEGSETELSHAFSILSMSGDGIIKASSFWRKREYGGSGFDYDNFRIVPLDCELSIAQADKIQFKISESYLNSLRSKSWIDDVEFGFIVLPVKLMDTSTLTEVQEMFAIKVTHKSSALVEPAEVVTPEVPFVQPHSEYTTPACSFESLFIPTLSASFFYNFYEPEEEVYEISDAKNYAGEKLSRIPKYVKLTWSRAPQYVEPLVVVSEEPQVTAVAEEQNSNIVFSDGMVWVLNPEVVASIIEESPRTSEDAGIIYDFTPPVVEDPFVTINPTSEFLAGINAKSEYVGYVIQKERYDEDSQEFTPVDLFVITDRSSNQYIDWKIAYGEIYRYQIRSIFKFVNRSNLPMYKDSDQLFDINQESERFETGLKIFETYYYDSKFSPPVEIEAVETLAPNSPEDLRIFPNSKKREMLLTWRQKNSNKDVLGFNVYRKTEGDTFKKINSSILPVRTNLYVDSSIDYNIDYIYAIESIDVHNNYSKLSAQKRARITLQNPEAERLERPSRLVEFPGQDLFEEPASLADRTDNLMFFEQKFSIIANPTFHSTEPEECFVLKIKSLDVGEEKEIKVKFTTITTYHREENSGNPVGFYGNYFWWPGLLNYLSKGD